MGGGKPRWKRKGVAAMIGGIILLTIIFGAVSTYFQTVQRLEQLTRSAAMERGITDLEQQLETFVMSTSVLGDGDLGLKVENNGPITVKIVGVFVFAPNGTLIPNSIATPFVVNHGSTMDSLDTNVRIVANQTYLVKVVTERGNLVSQTYPLPVIPGVAEAAQRIAEGVTTVAIGRLLIDYGTFRTCIPATMNCQPTSTAWAVGWKVRKNDLILFRINIKNFGSKRILLSEDTVITGLGPMGVQQAVNSFTFHIKKPPTATDNDGGGYTPDFAVALESNVYATVYFGATRAGNDDLSKFTSDGIFQLILALFAFEDDNNSGQYEAASDTTPYAQSIPFQGVKVFT